MCCSSWMLSPPSTGQSTFRYVTQYLISSIIITRRVSHNSYYYSGRLTALMDAEAMFDPGEHLDAAVVLKSPQSSDINAHSQTDNASCTYALRYQHRSYNRAWNIPSISVSVRHRGVQSRNQWPKWAEMKIIYQHCFNIYWHEAPRQRSALSAARLHIKMSTKHRRGHAEVLFQRAVWFVFWEATIICTGGLQDGFQVCEVSMRQIKLCNHSNLSKQPDLINYYLRQRLKLDLNQMRKKSSEKTRAASALRSPDLKAPVHRDSN